MNHDIRALIDDAVNHINDALHVLTEAMAILNTDVSYGPTTVVEDEPALPLEGGTPHVDTTKTPATPSTTDIKTE